MYPSCGTMSIRFLSVLALLVVSIYAQAQDADHSDCPAFINSIMAGPRPISMDNRWTWVLGEDGALELVDLSQVPVEIDILMRDLSDNIKFYLFTVSNRESGQIIDPNDEGSLDRTNFKVDKPTRFVIHGWKGSVNSSSNILIRDAYLNLGEYNVIVVDWSYYAIDWYVITRLKIYTVGKYVAHMINYLERHHMSLDDLYVVGHSLGAHVAGVACRHANNTVAALVGLDPAGPLFFNTSVSRMRATDAEFVKVIHTNAGTLGTDWGLGDVDFWPNGGEDQLGCGEYDFFGICAHSRSYEYFAESVTADSSGSSRKFIAHGCESFKMYADGNCASNNFTWMGGSYLDTNATAGHYFLHTNETSPYALGHPVKTEDARI